MRRLGASGWNPNDAIPLSEQSKLSKSLAHCPIRPLGFRECSSNHRVCVELRRAFLGFLGGRILVPDQLQFVARRNQAPWRFVTRDDSISPSLAPAMAPLIAVGTADAPSEPILDDHECQGVGSNHSSEPPAKGENTKSKSRGKTKSHCPLPCSCGSFLQPQNNSTKPRASVRTESVWRLSGHVSEFKRHRFESLLTWGVPVVR